MTTRNLVRRSQRRLPSCSARRRGTTLVELLVAIPVLAIVSAIAVAVLLAAHRQARATDGKQGNLRELRHAGMVVSAELRPLQPGDLVAWTDTSLEFNALVGTGVACDTRRSRRTIDMLPTTGADPARSAWITPADPQDVVSVSLAPGNTFEQATRWSGAVDAIGTSSACETSPLRGSPGRAIRLTLRDSLPTDPQDGSPVRITRRVRYALYRGADGRWYLGRRAFDGTAWEVAQPVAGPLLSASLRGVQFIVTDSTLAPITSGAPRPAAVQVRLRAQRAGTAPAIVDSTFTDIALRGRDDA